MIKNKNWWKSKTVWAAIFTAGIVIASTIWGDTNYYVAGAIAIGSMLGIYGRFIATTELK